MSGEGVDIDLYADDIGEDFNAVCTHFWNYNYALKFKLSVLTWEPISEISNAKYSAK